MKEAKPNFAPHIVRDRTPRWKVVNVKTLTGVLFPSEADANEEMIAHQLLAIWWGGKSINAGAIFDFAHLLAKNSDKVKAAFEGVKK